MPPALPEVWTRRRRLIEESPQLQFLEDPMCKRPWEGRRGIFGHGVRALEERVIEARETWTLDRVEALLRERESPVTMHELEMDLIHDPKDAAVLEVLATKHGDNIPTLLSTLASEQSIPYLAALRHTDEGLAKRARWEHTWDLQRREGLGASVGEIPVPPKQGWAEFLEGERASLGCSEDDLRAWRHAAKTRKQRAKG